MPIDILMPQLSPTMTEGRLANWLKSEGDKIQAGDVIAEVETDKATMEVEATADGILHAILEKPGEDIQVGAPIGVMKEDGEKVAKDYQPTSKAKAPEAAEEAPAETVEAAPAPAPVATPAPVPAVMATANTSPVMSRTAPAAAGKQLSSPVARRIAAERGLDLTRIVGTGPKGAIIKQDAESAVPGQGTSGPVVRRADTEEKLSPMRKAIATRLTQSKQSIPHFYLTDSVRMDDLMHVRQQINAIAPLNHQDQPAYKVSVNDLIIKASALAIAKYPEANAGWAGDKLVKFGNVDISVAVSIDGGLITPVVQNADQKSIVALSTEMKSLAKRARAGELKPEEYEGGSFSISNLGMYGISNFSAVINPPQPAILAVGKATPQPVVNPKNNLVEVAQVMEMTMSVDHRVIDGALGAELLAAIKFYLENPAAMLV